MLFRSLAARLGEVLLSGAEGAVRLRKALIFRVEFFAACNYALLGAPGARGPHVQGLRELRALLAPLRELGAALGVLRLEALARLLDVAQL